MLSHPNVLSLSGIIKRDDQFALVSEWMVNGNINQFVERHQAVNRLELVRVLMPQLLALHFTDDHLP
jgi:hypothetical protein